MSVMNTPQPPAGAPQRIVTEAGAFPIVKEIALRGALAVAGSPNAQQDVLCCRVGMSILNDHSH